MGRVDGRAGALVLGTFVDAVDWVQAIARIRGWASARESRYVCVCNVHSVVTGTRDPSFQATLNQADLVTADGAPVAWMLRRLGFPAQERIDGPDLMWRYCQDATRSGQGVALFGGTSDNLIRLTARLREAFPDLRICGTWSPPFRPSTREEDERSVAAINASGAQVVFVGLGCPKQENWMGAHRGRVQAVMIGVGAAFDFHSGSMARAPMWVQRMGLEWSHRLLAEPRRLWKRYLVTNTLFIIRAGLQLGGHCVRALAITSSRNR